MGVEQPEFIQGLTRDTHLAELREKVSDIELRISAEDDLVEPGLSAIDVCIRFGAGMYNGVDAELLTQESVVPVCCISDPLSPLLPHFYAVTNSKSIENGAVVVKGKGSTPIPRPYPT